MAYETTIDFVENSLGRKLTEEEKQRIELDCKSAERINTGSVETLKALGIEVNL